MKSANDSDSITDPEEGRYRILFEEKFQGVVLCDYGSDFNAITHSLFKQVKAAGPSLAVTNFEKPMVLKVAFDTDKSVIFSASRSVIITITIILSGSNIPVPIRVVD